LYDSFKCAHILSVLAPLLFNYVDIINPILRYLITITNNKKIKSFPGRMGPHGGGDRRFNIIQAVEAARPLIRG